MPCSRVDYPAARRIFWLYRSSVSLRVSSGVDRYCPDVNNRVGDPLLPMSRDSTYMRNEIMSWSVVLLTTERLAFLRFGWRRHGHRGSAGGWLTGPMAGWYQATIRDICCGIEGSYTSHHHLTLKHLSRTAVLERPRCSPIVKRTVNKN